MLTIQRRRNFRNLNDEGFLCCSDVESFERCTGRKIREFVEEFGLDIRTSVSDECDFSDAREYFESLLPIAFFDEHYSYPDMYLFDDTNGFVQQLELF